MSYVILEMMGKSTSIAIANALNAHRVGKAWGNWTAKSSSVSVTTKFPLKLKEIQQCRSLAAGVWIGLETLNKKGKK